LTFSQPQGKGILGDSEILCESHPKFIPILGVDPLMDLGENEYVTALKKGHTPVA